MIGSAGQGDSTPKITLSEFTTSKELMEKELDARIKRKWGFRIDVLKTRLGSRLAKYVLLHLDQGRRAGHLSSKPDIVGLLVGLI